MGPGYFCTNINHGSTYSEPCADWWEVPYCENITGMCNYSGGAFDTGKCPGEYKYASTGNNCWK
jgi:hypothetical protein